MGFSYEHGYGENPFQLSRLSKRKLKTRREKNDYTTC